MAEQYLDPDDPIVQTFSALPVGAVMEVPIGALTPTISDDMTASRTAGPPEIYALRALTPRRLGKVVLWIADGNHRYFEHRNRGAATIHTRKVIPDPEHDIHIMFDAADNWEDL